MVSGQFSGQWSFKWSFKWSVQWSVVSSVVSGQLSGQFSGQWSFQWSVQGFLAKCPLGPFSWPVEHVDTHVCSLEDRLMMLLRLPFDSQSNGDNKRIEHVEF